MDTTTFHVFGCRDGYGRTPFIERWTVDDAPIYERNERGTMIEVGRGPGVRGQVFRANLWEHIRRARKAGRKVVFKHEGRPQS